MSTATGLAPAEVAAAMEAETPGVVAAALRRILRRPSVIISLTWLTLVIISSAFAAFLAPHDPLAQDLANRLSGPSGTYWLGTDEFGRDLLSRIMHGGGYLLVAAIIPVVIAYLIGVPAGLFVGYVGGKADQISDFIVNVLFAIPALVIVLAISIATNNNLIILTAVFGVIVSGGIFRLVRSSTQSARDLLYVDAARVTGVSRGKILLRHILPNVTGPLIVQAFLLYSGAFLFLASLSFLGLGFSPETPSWGAMVFQATGQLDKDPWMMVPIGVALIGTIAAVNLIGNSLLEALPTAQRSRLFTRSKRPDHGPAGGKPAPVSLDRAVPDQNIDPDAVLVVDQLVVAFPTPDGGFQPVVDGVSFTVRRGQTMGLVGESGCGKTMTALALLGLVPPPGVATGSVLLDGRNLLELSEKEMAKVRGKLIGLVSQEPMVALDPCFTISDQLVEPIRVHSKMSRGAAKKRALELLRQVGIPNAEAIAKSFPHQLSGGMAQRVGIALALTGDPKVLVADEPTTALDPTIQAEILDLLRSLQKDLGLAIVLVTHDLGVVADICDASQVMYAGQVVEQSPVEVMLEAPHHPYTRGLLAAMPESAKPGEPLPTLPGTVPLPKDWPGWCRFEARCPFAVDACRAGAIPLLRDTAERTSRCIRHDDLVKGAV